MLLKFTSNNFRTNTFSNNEESIDFKCSYRSGTKYHSITIWKSFRWSFNSLTIVRRFRTLHIEQNIYKCGICLWTKSTNPLNKQRSWCSNDNLKLNSSFNTSSVIQGHFKDYIWRVFKVKVNFKDFSRTQKNSRTIYKIQGQLKDIKDVHPPWSIAHSLSGAFFLGGAAPAVAGAGWHTIDKN